MMMIDSWMVIGRFVSCFSDFFTNLPFFSTKIIIYFMVWRVVTFFKSFHEMRNQLFYREVCHGTSWYDIPLLQYSLKRFISQYLLEYLLIVRHLLFVEQKVSLKCSILIGHRLYNTAIILNTFLI